MNADAHEIAFWLDGKMVELDFARDTQWNHTTTVLNYLRSLPSHKGTKEGCAEGDCGACTVAIAEPDGNGGLRYRAIDSCLVFLPMIHGKQLITVESLGKSDQLHPVQQAMVDCDGSQCGYCTPGIVMSLFAMYKSADVPDHEAILDGLTGNLCRCTGYRPIVEAATKTCHGSGKDHFDADAPTVVAALENLHAGHTDLTLYSADHGVYHRPADLEKALELRALNPSAQLVCGATDVGLMVTKRKMSFPVVLDLSGIEALKSIQETPAGLRIGASASLESVKHLVKGRFPAMYAMLAVFGSRQIREMATLGGNLANASPIGDMPPVLMALDASVEVASVNGTRTMKVQEFITGYRTTALAAAEIITAVIIPPVPEGRIVRSYKVSKRKDLDISTASAGFWIQTSSEGTVTEIGLVYGGMAAMTKRARQAEQFLLGKPWNRATVLEALPLIDAEFTPISDARSSKEGRRVLARNLLLKFWADTAHQSHS